MTRRLPLAHPQRRVWYTEALHPGTGVGNLAGCVHVPGTPDDLPTLGRAVELVLARHDALRLRLVRTDGLFPDQVLTDAHPPAPEVWEPGEDRTPLLDESRRPLPLFDGPLHLVRLLVLPGGRVGWYFKYHHVVVDAWTVSLLNRQILDAWRALAAGAPVPPVEVPSFLEFLEREERYLASPERADDEAFWHGHLEGLATDTAASIPAASLGAPRPPAPSPIATRRYEHDLDAALTARIEEACRARETSVFRLFLASFALVLSGWSLGRDVVLSTGHHNRLTARDRELAGMTVSTLPVRMPLREDETFDALIRRIHATSAACLARQQYPYDLLAAHLRATDRDPGRLLRWFVNHVPSPTSRAEPDAPVVERYSPGADLAELNFKINPNQRPRGAPLQLCVDARVALHGEDEVRRIFARVEHLVRAGLEQPDVPLTALERTPPEERSTMRAWGTGPSTPPAGRCWPEAFAGVAARHGSAVALEDPWGKRTFTDLQAEVAAVAGALRHRGVGPGDRVIVRAARRAEIVVAALGVLHAGAVYVPVTPDTPDPRVDRILDDARAVLVLDAGLGADLPGGAWSRIPRLPVAEAARFPTPVPPAAVDPEDAAYVIFTSGSTGVPKGVVVPHRALAAHCATAARSCGWGPSDAVAATCSFLFDLSIGEVFPPLLAGARVVVVPDDARSSVHDLGRTFDAHGVTAALLPTRVGVLFERHVAAPGLRLLLVGGERLVLPPGHRPRRPLVNVYGPTETTVWVTAHAVEGTEDPIPIGRPVDGTRLYVMDPYGRPVGPGEEGELWVAGDQVATGYLGDPALTAARFVPDPGAGPRAYRTGDRVVFDPATGLLHYRGRLDRQVKVRGFRVEPGEVERCLLDHPAVAAAHVLVDGHGEARSLVAAWVARAESDSLSGHDDRHAGGPGLATHVAARLPAFMVPARFLRLPALPLTPNGKTDEAAIRAALGAPDPGSAPAGPSPEASPSEPGTTAVLALFREALGRPDLGPDDGFFEAGGDSLRAMQVLAALGATGGGGLSVSLLLQHPTARGLARALAGPPADPDLVTLRSEGSGRLLVCVHDFTGDLLPYLNVVKHLAGPWTVRGLRWNPTEAARTPTLEDLAARYARRVAAAAPTGPVHLLGYSLGGSLAFEMARVLRAEGREVAFLGLVDTPNYVRDRALLERFLVTALRAALAWLRGMSFTWKVAWVSAQWNRLTGRERIRDAVAAWRRMKDLALAWEPRPVDVPVTVLRSSARRASLGPDLGWTGLAPSLVLHEIGGDHITVMDDVHGARIARILDDLPSSGALPHAR